MVSAQAHKCSDGEQNTEIATWDDLDEEDEDSDLIRPESLTVTVIQENEGENGYHQPQTSKTARTRKESIGRKVKSDNK